MNRAERRRQQRSEKIAVRQYTDAQIEEIKRQAVAEACAARKMFSDEEIHQIAVDSTMKSLEMLLAIPVVILRDKYGYGKIRMNRFLGYMNTWIKAINEDENTVKEVIELAHSIAGYEVV